MVPLKIFLLQSGLTKEDCLGQSLDMTIHSKTFKSRVQLYELSHPNDRFMSIEFWSLAIFFCHVRN